jgi:hypothetical protein
MPCASDRSPDHARTRTASEPSCQHPPGSVISAVDFLRALRASLRRPLSHDGEAIETGFAGFAVMAVQCVSMAEIVEILVFLQRRQAP